MFPFRCSAEIESGASAAGTSELRSTSLQPGRSWRAASVLRRRLPICIVARSEAVACAPDRTSRLFRAVKTQKEKPPQDSLGWLGSGGVETPACEERGITPRRSADGLPPQCAVGGLRCAIQVSCCRARSRTAPLGLAPRCRRVPTIYAQRMCRALFWNNFNCGFCWVCSVFFAVLFVEFH